ncbi:hypothetical protein AGABI2DRAFT_123289 [Agaricus bisporus var. bisporus H97]|uniref:hypothetical protein n=1 Tax=Agaricus bisporus var. bisporus (strain H97 / ATCC MYA-4626 / FGSC 10389) TaxID=936046 RepID=UPI00029F5C22|nr:hypothetical protein AGABI2DRAFT_123289 [Agaricus bisporus var. bisporus H97]EKV41810.1 hypothetical protein AGABI2DRAFT_123289 [Agaricus bisporus var. bisporus H97]
MPTSKRKISDLAYDANSLLLSLHKFQESLDEDDEDQPGLVEALNKFRKKLISFSKVGASALLQTNIKSGPLILVPEAIVLAEEQGSAEVEGKALSMGVLKQLIELVRRHVSVVTQAGSRVLIHLILLRVASAMSTDQMDVNIIPEYPIFRALSPGHHSFDGVVNFLLTKLPGRYTPFLLGDPTIALGNPNAIKGPTSSTIFEAKRENVRVAIPRAVMA